MRISNADSVVLIPRYVLGITTNTVKLIYEHGTTTVTNFGASYHYESFFALVFKRFRSDSDSYINTKYNSVVNWRS